MANWLMTIKKKLQLKKSDNAKVSCILLTWLYTWVSYGVREQSLTPNLKACLKNLYIYRLRQLGTYSM